MKPNKLLVAAVLAIALGAPIAVIVGDNNMAQPTTFTGVRAPFLHGFSTEQTSSHSALTSLEHADEWLNSPPLAETALRGKVVLIDFWTYTCINWLRTLPYVRAWAEKYRDQGLVVVGVHSPEVEFEKDVNNVARAVQDLQVGYPVAIDSDHIIWRAFRNQYWPALYFVDAEGRVRYHHFGEGSYEQAEMVIQELLRENGNTGFDPEPVAVTVDARGIEAAADWGSLKSPEYYVGYARMLERDNAPGPGGGRSHGPRTNVLRSSP